MMSDPSPSVQPHSLNCWHEILPGGRVFLVGAGPGDPGLLTIRGRECLARADVVLYDGLANDQLLDFAPQAECVCVGKHGKLQIWTQDAINQRLVALAGEGKLVVRLKGGDPAVFARTAEELDVLSQAKIPFEVVPGITAALAAASYVGIPITHRQHASAVAFITGQQQSGGPPEDIDWRALADFPGTLVFYMGVTTAQAWTDSLLLAGKPAGTPAAIVRRCTWSDQATVRCRLDEVAGHLTPASKMRPPVIVIVGSVAKLGRDFDWFSQRPLHGCGILITRPDHQSEELAERLRLLGASVYHQPVLQVIEPGCTQAIDQAVERIQQGCFQGITFSSSNGVDGFFKRLAHGGSDSRGLAGIRLAAVGPATAKALERFGVRADVVPASNFSAAGLLETLSDSVRGEHWLVTNTNCSQETLATGLVALGAEVESALTYETREVSALRPGVESALDAGRVHLVAITSATIAEAAHRLLASFRDQLKPVGLSTGIRDRLKNLGWPAVIHASEHSDSALTAAIVDYWQVSRNA